MLPTFFVHESIENDSFSEQELLPDQLPSIQLFYYYHHSTQNVFPIAPAEDEKMDMVQSRAKEARSSFTI